MIRHLSFSNVSSIYSLLKCKCHLVMFCMYNVNLKLLYPNERRCRFSAYLVNVTKLHLSSLSPVHCKASYSLPLGEHLEFSRNCSSLASNYSTIQFTIQLLKLTAVVFLSYRRAGDKTIPFHFQVLRSLSQSYMSKLCRYAVSLALGVCLYI